MRVVTWWLVCCILVIESVAIAVPAHADEHGCIATGSLSGATATCETDGDTLNHDVASAPTGTIYKTVITCVPDATSGLCQLPLVCEAPPGAIRYDVLRSTDNGATFTKVSEACLTRTPDGATPDGPPVITPAAVATQFQALAWPASPLEVQPPGGRTLVNLETNFFTTNTAPSAQTVTLLEQQVEIEATPTSWLWDHGDGTTQTTAEPGAAYPALTITHTYTAADVTVAPRVDTTYSGRYRVNGGPWAAIPATVTVPGAAGRLTVVPATPQLVGAG